MTRLRLAVPSWQDLIAAHLGLLLMIFSWGAFFPILERLLQRWDVYSATLGRQLCGTLVLAACALALRRREPWPAVIPWRRILALGGTGVTIGSLLTSLGVLYSDGLSSAIISTTNPISSALTAAALFREPLGRGLLLGTALSVIGGLITVIGSQPAGGAEFRGGEMLIILANVLWTWMSLAAQQWLRGFSQLQITTLTVAAGAFWLLLLMPLGVIGGVIEPRIELSAEALGMVIFAGVVPIALGNFCWHYGVSRIGVVIASMYSNLLPGAALAVTVMLGGGFTWHQIVGCAIILAGVLAAQILALRSRRET